LRRREDCRISPSIDDVEKLMKYSDVDCAAAERRIREHVIETPVVLSSWLSALGNAQVYLKLENLQETGAFKLRGATNKLLSLTPDQAARGVVTASSGGNHALAIAATGAKLGIATEVFVPAAIDPARRAKIEAFGARVRTVDGDPLLAEQTARRAGEQSGREYASPYNDRAVMAGQGTIGVELLHQLPRLDAVFIAVGGGGLIGGIGAHLKSTAPAIEVVGCWPRNSPALYECIRAGRVIEVEEQPTLSVSTAGGVEENAITLPLCRDVIDRSVLVSEAEILDSLRRLYREDGQLVEGAAAVPVAAFRQVASSYAGKTVALLICGGNVSPRIAAMIKED
jgi:threonine dehydratase